MSPIRTQVCGYPYQTYLLFKNQLGHFALLNSFATATCSLVVAVSFVFIAVGYDDAVVVVVASFDDSAVAQQLPPHQT